VPLKLKGRFSGQQKRSGVPLWDASISSKLEKYNATINLDRLSSQDGLRDDVDRVELRRRLRNLSAYSPDLEPRKYPKRRARDEARYIRNAANLIQDLNDRCGYSVLLGENWHLTKALPGLLRDYAQRVEKLPEEVQEKWEPVKVAAISQFVWYVETRTGSNYDEDVSAIIGAFLKDGLWNASALKQWLTRNARAIDSLGPLNILPVIPRSPR